MSVAPASIRLGSGIVVPPAFGLSAVVLAHARAVESRRPDRVLDDHVVERFVAAAGWSVADDDHGDGVGDHGAEAASPSGSPGIVGARFLDDLTLDAGHRQVVVLGAGSDTRAFRLPWPDGTVVYEIDQPDLVDLRDRVLAGLATGCTRVPVPVEPDSPWAPALRRAGFTPGLPTTWLVDGTPVRPEQVAVLLRRLGGLSAPGSVVGATTSTAGPARPHDGQRGWDVRLHDPARVALELGRADLAGAGHRAAIGAQTWLLHAVRT
ncbi:SAM-dependent methyltransferase [Nocardioides sp. C4-1]|uniref:SAM-dependent methyltransferase n=1 Tax=Nocardioides sp. C4-1 TaxID=3151851 RepID=UPI003263DDA8